MNNAPEVDMGKGIRDAVLSLNSLLANNQELILYDQVFMPLVYVCLCRIKLKHNYVTNTCFLCRISIVSSTVMQAGLAHFSFF